MTWPTPPEGRPGVSPYGFLPQAIDKYCTVLIFKENFFQRKDVKLSVKNISPAFAAGCLGGLANAVSVCGFGALGVTAALGVKIAPAFAASFLYQKLVWGGIWVGSFCCR